MLKNLCKIQSLREETTMCCFFVLPLETTQEPKYLHALVIYGVIGSCTRRSRARAGLHHQGSSLRASPRVQARAEKII
jgi:uncharacterized protein involved in response to NO